MKRAVKKGKTGGVGAKAGRDAPEKSVKRLPPNSRANPVDATPMPEGICEPVRKEMNGGSFSLSVGPVHPALKEPVRFNLEIEGERVVKVDFEMSQVHRGIEWMGTRRNPIQIIHLAERICGICNICHSLAFCRAVEGIAGIEVPERAHYIRAIVAELERIHSHVLWAGVAAHELGFDSVMHYTWKMRERVLDIIEELTGNRITKGMIMIGGVRRDISREQAAGITRALEFYSRGFERLCGIFMKDPVIMARTRGTGILGRKDALAFSAVGPTARASGVEKDVRQDEAYAAYPALAVEAITPMETLGEIRGDVFDRIVVRLLEVKQSVGIIGKCLEQMPGGKIVREEKPAKLLADLKGVEGEGIGRIEAPRGEVIHYVKLVGEEAPFSWKVRAPTYNNLLPWLPMLLGAQIADVPVIAASTDPCMSCANRAVVADGDKTRVLDNEAMRMLSVEKTRALGRRLK
jgi:membrane-bound hydrogenase subunit alpha